jgi:hypothetical protein
MLLHDDGHARPVRDARRGTFAFTAETRLLSALGRSTYAFMCLRWEALWLYGALSGHERDADDEASRRLARADAAVVALRLQSRTTEGTVDGELRRALRRWADAFAACADLHYDIQRAHPGADGLWSLPTDTPERLTLADRPADLLGYAQRFEALALEAQTLRRRLQA